MTERSNQNAAPVPTSAGDGGRDRGRETHIVERARAATCPTCKRPRGRLPFCPCSGHLYAGFTLNERYEVEKATGAGPAVFRFQARHRGLGRPVVVQVLRPELAKDPERLERFREVARKVSGVHHDNVLSPKDVGHDTKLGLHYLVFDPCRGPSLADVLERSGAMDPAPVVEILVQVVRALRAAHREGVVHGALDARHTMLEPTSGRAHVAKVVDFGLASVPDAGGSRAEDVRAFGALGYQLLTGVHPDATGSPPQRPSELRETTVPGSLESVLMGCLAEGDAPGDLEEIEAALEGSGTKPAVTGDLVGRTIGSYRVERLLGSGGAGAVYLAEHPIIGTRVAIKVLRSELSSMPGVTDRFVLEARASGEIGSHHIPRYFDFGELPDGRAYAVMEYLEGENLTERIHRAGPVSLEEAIGILEQVAQALHEAHGAGIIHRDVKPENVFLAQQPRGATQVKILDFGIAKMTMASQDSSLTQAGTFVGTPVYCAPEQAFGQDVGPTADIYALGATAYEILTGHPPYEGDLSDIWAAKQQGAPARLVEGETGLPEVVIEGLGRMLASSPRDRFGSMEGVLEALASWRGEAGTAGVVSMDVPSSGFAPAHTPTGPSTPVPAPRAAGPSTPMPAAPGAVSPGAPTPGEPSSMPSPPPSTEASAGAPVEDPGASVEDFALPTRSSGRGLVWATLAAVVLLAGGVGVWWMAWGEEPAPPASVASPPAEEPSSSGPAASGEAQPPTGATADAPAVDEGEVEAQPSAPTEDGLPRGLSTPEPEAEEPDEAEDAPETAERARRVREARQRAARLRAARARRRAASEQGMDMASPQPSGMSADDDGARRVPLIADPFAD